VKQSPLQKTALQISIVVAATLPVVAGIWDVIHRLQGADAWAINHQRYLSGLLMAIGVGFWSSVPDIEAKTARIRLLTFLVVVGGLCRLLGVAMGDPLSQSVIVALSMELVVTPALCWWQSRFAQLPPTIVAFSPKFDS
jgi:hypothetical protein